MSRVIAKVRDFLLAPLVYLHRDQTDFLMYLTTEDVRLKAENTFARYGAKYFSQSDEDGLTLEILRRLQLEKGTFAEFGVGNGSENNTLILIAHGWKGFWVGGSPLFFNYKGQYKRFIYHKDWIKLANIAEITRKCLEKLGSSQIDVISLDLDGNDIYFVEELLAAGFTPQLFVVEYNARFPPPVRWQTGYDDNHRWNWDDYFGASLASFVDLFGRYGYWLVCCNAQSGANAFFVRTEKQSLFPEVPRELSRIFCGPRYYLYSHFGHNVSPRTVERMLELNEKAAGDRP
jgi:hypothetical protein